jgi:hypothetical protein
MRTFLRVAAWIIKPLALIDIHLDEFVLRMARGAFKLLLHRALEISVPLSRIL